MSTPSIDAVAEMDDPVLRNLWITQTYHELGLRMAARGLDEDATWPLFAVWASKSAGRIIRGDELPDVIRDRISTSAVLASARQDANRKWRWPRYIRLVEALTHEHLTTIVDGVTNQVSAHIARGNVIVFQEQAPLFEALAAGEQPDPGRGLIDAAARYQTALAEQDAGKRAIQVLGANVRAVAHEQRRLQAHIAAAVDAPIESGLHRLLDEQIGRFVPGRVLRSIAGDAVGDLCTELKRLWEDAATSVLMRLSTPDEEFDLHETLPAPPGGEPLFPPALSGCDAAHALGAWDTTLGTGYPCGADDWVSLKQRMAYIVNLFRSRQRCPSLFDPPFTDAQLDAMSAGRLPDGPV